MNTRQLRPVRSPTTPTVSFTPVRGGLLQRKCACGGTPGLTGECEACRKKRETGTLRQKDGNRKSEIGTPPIVHETLRSPGQSLVPAPRRFVEPLFSYNFSDVSAKTRASTELARYARFIGDVEDTPTLVPGAGGGSGPSGSKKTGGG